MNGSGAPTSQSHTMPSGDDRRTVADNDIVIDENRRMQIQVTVAVYEAALTNAEMGCFGDVAAAVNVRRPRYPRTGKLQQTGPH